MVSARASAPRPASAITFKPLLAANGCPGWTYDECLPWFQKQEDQEDDTNPTAGKGGPLAVTNAGLHDPNPASAALTASTHPFSRFAMKSGSTPDLNGVGPHSPSVSGPSGATRTSFACWELRGRF